MDIASASRSVFEIGLTHRGIEGNAEPRRIISKRVELNEGFMEGFEVWEDNHLDYL